MRVSRTFRPGVATASAVTIGNFDGVHLGHQAMLDRLGAAARELALPSCVLTFEPHPREFFAPDQAPARLTSLREKLQLLAQHGVDRTQICRFNFDFAKTTPEDFIERVLRRGLGARWVLVGDDFRFGARRAGDLTMLKQAASSCGFEVFARLGVESLVVLEYTLVHLVFGNDTLRKTAAGGAPGNYKGDCENEQPWFNSLQLHSFSGELSS